MARKKTAKRARPSKPSTGLIGWFISMSRILPGFFWPLLGFSLAVNMLMMVSPIYMLQVYDRILTSGSQDTLIWITIISVFLLAVYAAAEAARRRISGLAAEVIEEKMSQRIFDHFENNHAGVGRLTNDLSVLGRVRSMYQNHMILPFFDLPFAPVFLLIMFIVHPIIGFIGLGGAAIVFIVAVTAELSARRTNEQATAASSQAFQIASGLSRQRSAIIAMGLSTNAQTKWRAAKSTARDLNLKAGAKEGGFAAIARSLRQVLQVLVLGGGAALAIQQQVSPGAIVAGSIIMSRALAPIDQIVGSWRSVAQARLAWQQLEELDQQEEKQPFTPLPRPAADLKLDRLAVAFPGETTPIVRPFGVQISGNQFVSLAGPIGAGKTTILQTIAGAWPPSSGSVTLDGRDVHDWPSEDRGQYFGYMPQDVELLPGTIAENIARMGEATPEEVIAAAHRAGAHEMILAQPNGYDTPIGSASGDLSAGQRQLVGLARAMFGEPVVLLLDEPTANLDPKTAAHVIGQLKQAAARGAVVIVSTHDPLLISATDMVLVIRNGALMSAKADEYLKLVGDEARSNVTPIGARMS